MNVAACYCVYNDYEFLQASVDSIAKYVDEIYFLYHFQDMMEKVLKTIMRKH